MSTTENAPLTGSGNVRSGTFARGAVAGVGAWLLGYLITYVWKSETVSETLDGVGFVSQMLGGEAIPAWKGVAWFFMNAHFVATRFPTVMGDTRTVNFVTGEGGTSLLLALPPVVLLAVGAAAAYGRASGVAGGAKAGASLALGYLPLSAAAAFLTTHHVGDTEAVIAPVPVTAVLLAGVVYPAACGAIGGAASSALE